VKLIINKLKHYFMNKSENIDPLQWMLTREDKSTIDDSLVRYIVDHNLQQSDLEVNGSLAFALVPYLERYNSKWSHVENQAALEGAKFYKAMIARIKHHFRYAAKALELRINDEKFARSEEARSKGNKNKSVGSDQNQIDSSSKPKKKQS
jgi:hypothetical protein